MRLGECLESHQMNEISLLRGIVVYLLIGHALHFMGIVSDRGRLVWPLRLVDEAAIALRRRL